ncbi:MAG: DNA polymerase III subunit delta [Verrucomicrobiota bacterium]
MPASKQIFAFFGTDEARVKEEALKLSRKLTPPENAEFGLDIVNGAAETSEHAGRIISETIQALQTLPFLGGDKTVWLQGATLFADTVTGRAQGTVAAVERLTKELEAGLPPGVFLIIHGTAIDKRRAFYKKLKKLAELNHYDLPDPSQRGWEQEVMVLAKKRAKALKFGFEPDALEHFVMTTGENTRQIDSELEKLKLFLGERDTANVDDIRAIISTSRAGVIFEIGDAMAARDLPRTINLLDQQLQKGESAIGILLAAIVPRVRSMLLARDLFENHQVSGANYRAYQSQLDRLPPSATAHLPKKKDGGVNAYPIFLAAGSCRGFTLAELKDAMQACLDANRRLVTTQMEQGTVLSQLVTQILTKRRAQAA